MRLYEAEGKRLFQKKGIPLPLQYGIIETPEDLDNLEVKFPLILKALVLVGGRGKAGGIKRAESLEEAKDLAGQLLQLKIKGESVERLLVEEALEEQRACYIGVTANPANFNNVVMVSPSGGVDIEEVAKNSPEKILKREIPDNDRNLPPALAGEMARFLNQSLQGDEKLEKELREILSRIYALYQEGDCKVVEINPLMITPRGPVAADSKVVLDDNGLYRQTSLLSDLGISTKRHDVSEATANERRAAEAGFPYVDLLPEGFQKDPEKLYVGLVPGGAGYGIFSIDEVANIGERFFGGKVVPVNFMDSGGGPTIEKVAEMFHLLMDYEVVDLIITSRFGGISSCDTFIRGAVHCIEERSKKGMRMVPIHGRMVGTDLPSARACLEKAKREKPDLLQNLEIVVGNQMIMAEVIRKGIEKAVEKKL